MPEFNFQYNAQDLQRALDLAFEKKRAAIKKVTELPTRQRNFKTVVLPLEETNGDLADVMGLLGLFSLVDTDKKFRDACIQMTVNASNEMRALYRSEELCKAVKDVTAKKEKLNSTDAKLLLELEVELKLLGLDLSKVEREKLALLQKELTALEQKYQDVINQWRDSITLSKTETEGLSKHFLAQLPRDKKGNYIVSLDYSAYFPFMQFSKNAKKREEIAQKFFSRAGKENMQRLFDMVELRQEIAHLLGYRNHAEMRLQLRMIKNDVNALKFVGDSAKKVRPKALAYLKELRKLKQKELGQKAELKYFDLLHYASEYFNQKYDLDLETLRTFFPIENVTKGILEIYQKLLGLRFVEKKGKKLWYKTARAFEVWDTKTQKFIGNFVIDLHPREGKYTHACVMPVRSAREQYGTWVTPVAVLIANFTEPTKGNPGYLTHKEITTYFHEFGHIMHNLLSKVKYYSFSGTNTAQDFVEAPSQMLEYWLWDTEMLRSVAKVPKGKEKPYNTLIKNLLASEKVGSSHFILAQMVQSQLDLNIHTKKFKDAEDMRQEYQRLLKKFTGIDAYAKQLFLADWGHMVGYDSAYYGYMWARAIACDMLTVFEKLGLNSPKAGRRYRKEILEKGGSYDPEVLVENFIGRKIRPDALLRRLG